jgi:hypothetical protein
MRIDVEKNGVTNNKRLKHPYVMASIIFVIYSFIMCKMVLTLGIYTHIFRGITFWSTIISLFFVWTISCYIMFRFSN